MVTTPSRNARFRAIFDAHHRELHAYCLRRLPVRRADDAAVEVFLVAWRRLGDIPTDGTRLWLYGIARDVVGGGSDRRTQVVAREGVTVPASSGPHEIQIVRHPDHEAVHRALKSLREVDREIVQMSLWEDLTTEQIALILGLSVRSVEARYVRALVRTASCDDGATGDQFDEADRVRSVDAVPSRNSVPTGTISGGSLLARIDDRVALVGTERPVEMDPPAGGGRGVLLALTVAVLGLAVVVIVAVTIAGLTDRPPPSTASPTTLAPPTTTVTTTLDPNPLAYDIPPLEVVETMYRRWHEADIDGYRALVDAGTVRYNLESFDHAAWYRLLSGVTDIRTCRLESVDTVSCTTTYYSGLAFGQELVEGHAVFTIADGKVVDIDPLEQLGLFNSGFDRQGLVEYRNWVFDNEPERFDELFAFGTSILLHTSELRDVHGALMDRYRSETAPPGALVDAEPIKVVATYYGRILAGDVDGYRELVVSGSEATQALIPSEAETWYFTTTRIASGRICDTTSAFHVTCDVTYYSGLAPGTELTGRILQYTVIGGAIVDIDTPDAIESVIVADEPALARYRAWLVAEDPQAATDLFTSRGTLILDTEPTRLAHEQHIARYLDSVGG